MFNLQYSALKKSVGDETARILSECEAELNHQGPVEFGGPVKFDQPPIGIAPNYIEGVLSADLVKDGFIVQIVNGQFISKNNLITGSNTAIRLSGRAIQEDFTILSGTPFGACWNGTDWTMVWPLVGPLYIEGELTGDLASGATRSEHINDNYYTINGKAIRSGRSISTGAKFGARWNGTDYTMIWANECDV